MEIDLWSRVKKIKKNKGKKTAKYSERRVFPKIGEKLERRVNLDKGSIKLWH
jgi:hypothetical protein